MTNKVDKELRARFWELDDQIRAIMATLEPINERRNALADAEAEIRDKVKDLQAERAAIVADSGLDGLTRERSRMSNALAGRTGLHP